MKDEDEVEAEEEEEVVAMDDLAAAAAAEHLALAAARVHFASLRMGRGGMAAFRARCQLVHLLGEYVQCSPGDPRTARRAAANDGLVNGRYAYVHVARPASTRPLPAPWPAAWQVGA